MKQLEKDFNLIALDYVTQFTEKHHLQFKEWEGEIGSIAVFENCKASFENIRFDINKQIQRGMFLKWYWDGEVINYIDYLTSKNK